MFKKLTNQENKNQLNKKVETFFCFWIFSIICFWAFLVLGADVELSNSLMITPTLLLIGLNVLFLLTFIFYFKKRFNFIKSLMTALILVLIFFIITLQYFLL